MDLIRRARSLETQIARTLGAAARSLARQEPREPIEVAHAIADAVERSIQLGSRGRRVFPFDTIAVSVLAPSPEARIRMDAVLVAEPSLQTRLAERLRRAGCEVPALLVRVDYVARAGKSWTDPDFGLALSAEGRDHASASAVEPIALPRVDLTIVRGTAQHRSYRLDGHRVCLGRGAEVRDQRNHLVRTNDVAFVEAADEVNRSVSRQHAHVDYDREIRGHRLYDDGSAQGTGIVREGRTIAVPRGGNGVRLRSGDEIVLGEARLRFTPGR